MKTKPAKLPVFMRGNPSEAECVVRLDATTGMASICVAEWPKMARKLARIYGPSLDADLHSGPGKVRSARWEVPLNLVGFRRPGLPRKSGQGRGLALQTPQTSEV